MPTQILSKTPATEDDWDSIGIQNQVKGFPEREGFFLVKILVLIDIYRPFSLNLKKGLENLLRAKKASKSAVSIHF